jgi:hypothetical protein
MQKADVPTLSRDMENILNDVADKWILRGAKAFLVKEVIHKHTQKHT